MIINNNKHLCISLIMISSVKLPVMDGFMNYSFMKVSDHNSNSSKHTMGKFNNITD